MRRCYRTVLQQTYSTKPHTDPPPWTYPHTGLLAHPVVCVDVGFGSDASAHPQAQRPTRGAVHETCIWEGPGSATLLLSYCTLLWYRRCLRFACALWVSRVGASAPVKKDRSRAV